MTSKVAPHLPWRIVAIGTSAGGLKALQTLFSALPYDFSVPIVVVQHRSADCDSNLAQHLNSMSSLHVKDAQDGDLLRPGTIYMAPAGYHLLIENDEHLSLCVSEKINYSRPSIDVLFENVASVYAKHALAIILTGANNDGTNGAKVIKSEGGTVIVQDPKDAEVSTMPQAAIDAAVVDYILSLAEIKTFLQHEVINDDCHH